MNDSPCAIDRLLERTRAHLDRVEPAMLDEAVAAGAVVVDIRPVEQRSRDGEMPGALVIDRNVLEWRLDPTCPHRLPGAVTPGSRVIVVCNEGYQSSLAAATLQELGLRNAPTSSAATRRGSLADSSSARKHLPNWSIALTW